MRFAGVRGQGGRTGSGEAKAVSLAHGQSVSHEVLGQSRGPLAAGVEVADGQDRPLHGIVEVLQQPGLIRCQLSGRSGQQAHWHRR